MSKRGRRVRAPRGPHKDKYAPLATTAQQELATLNSKWEREHPAPATPAPAPADSEEEEAV